MEVGRMPHELNRTAVMPADTNEDLPAEPIYVCSVCGNTVMGQPPEQCPVCAAPRDQFKEVR